MIHPLTKTESIYADLKDKIIKGYYNPKDKLVISTLAKTYGTSGIPVREALKELTAEGLVETTPHIGSSVQGLSLADINDMLEMRELLEPLAAELAAKRASAEDIKKLEILYNTCHQAFQHKDIKAYTAANREFHHYILDMSRNSYLIKTIEDLMNVEKRMRKIFHLFPDVIANSDREHALFLSYFKSGKAKEVGQLMLTHKKRSFDKIRKYFEENDT